MTGMLTLTATEAKLVSRDPAGLVLPIGLPVLILVMNGLGADGTVIAELGGLPVLDAVIVPIVLVMVMAMIAIINMPSFLATYRTTGVLRRLAVTPAHPAMVLAAQAIVSLMQAAIGIAAALVMASLAFDVSLPINLVGAVVALGLGAFAMYALGMVVAAVSPSTNAAIAIGLVVFFGMLALGGGFGPRENLPDWLATIGEYLPFGATSQALSDSWIGASPGLLHLGVLGAVGVVAGAAAAKLFRWE